jgi:hypothetical protein
LRHHVDLREQAERGDGDGDEHEVRVERRPGQVT